MIIFYQRKADDVMLASVLKHYNPNAIIREYEDNSDVLRISKIHRESNFIRVSDYKSAIMKTYKCPRWINDELKKRFIELLLCHKNIDTNKLVEFLSENLFFPELVFFDYTDASVEYKSMVAEVVNELEAFRRLSAPFLKNKIIFYDINPEHNIMEVFAKSKAEEIDAGFVVLCGDKAIVMNAKDLGFQKEMARISRFDAFRLRRKIKILKVKRNKVIKTIAKTIYEF